MQCSVLFMTSATAIQSSYLDKIFNIISSKWTIPTVFLVSILLNNCNQLFVQHAWAISLFAKQLIEFILPAIIFCLVSSGLISLGIKGTKTIIVSLSTVFIFNFVFFWTLYPFLDTAIFDINPEVATQLLGQDISIYKPAWSMDMPFFIGTEKGLIAGIAMWLITSTVWKHKASSLQDCLGKIAATLMKNVLTPVIPLFLFGFAVNVNFEFMLPVFQSYAHVIILVSSLQYFFFILIMFACEGRQMLSYIKHMMPALIIGFTTMSSSMAIAKVITGLEGIGISKKFSSPILSLIFLPFTWGDIFLIPALLAISIKIFGLPSLDLKTYCICALYFALLKHTCCSMAGGAAICSLPLMKNVLHFSDSMAMFVISLTIVLDAITTSVNVAGHFLMPMILRKFLGNKEGDQKSVK